MVEEMLLSLYLSGLSDLFAGVGALGYDLVSLFKTISDVKYKLVRFFYPMEWSRIYRPRFLHFFCSYRLKSGPVFQMLVLPTHPLGGSVMFSFSKSSWMD